MKKILMLGMSLNVGGAEKSLVNLLNMIDYTQYSVDLLLFQKEGAFLNQVPEEVNIIDVHEIKVLYQSVKKTLTMHDKKFIDLYLVLVRYFASLVERVKWKQFDQVRLHRWLDFYSKLIPMNLGEYDVAVAYAGGDTAYYMVDKVPAKRKVYFFHSDYSNIDIDADLERKYVDKVDAVITISDVCKKSLETLFPEKKEDIHVLNNLSSTELIVKLAKDYIAEEFDVDSKYIKLVSVGRLHHIKGFDMAVEAAHILKEKDILFRWIIVGEGNERSTLEPLIEKYGLCNEFILVGLKENPYPYVLAADILLQTSRFEGKSVVLDEARVLKKPAIITNYNSAHEQIDDGVNGLIVEMNATAIAEGIEKVAKNKKIIEEMAEAIKQETVIENVSDYMKTLIGDVN